MLIGQSTCLGAGVQTVTTQWNPMLILDARPRIMFNANIFLFTTNANIFTYLLVSYMKVNPKVQQLIIMKNGGKLGHLTPERRSQL